MFRVYPSVTGFSIYACPDNKSPVSSPFRAETNTWFNPA
ncbi:MAG: hypothetical protein OP8BY_1430 [Candidatus Saccharicenans subterraneus]|uniref:Uncharacterized protein n=1 Tax=Candidatus Saccharicenans subterraneus TaxID=2508984 RepID=A0A3E2BJL3_9BACT|nr:MAG: hypothetical protein OP8BY_1430 [Candidatus Saccharicenans subterraneum]